MGKCSLCGKWAGFINSFDLKDGKCCLKCAKLFDKAGILLPNFQDYSDFTAEEVKHFLDDPEKWNNIAQERREKREITSEKCLICGGSFKVGGKYYTADAYAICLNCLDGAITISPQEFLKGDREYIRRHDSNFFKENMGQLERPHLALYVNFSKKRFFYAGEIRNTPDCVFSFDSVIKFETDMQTYEVVVGKKGHPIARAVAGGALFGKTGAVVGAMTAKDTRHKEIMNGRQYVAIYHKDANDPNKIWKRTCYCKTDEDVVKLENCLKRAFECNEEEKKKESVIEERNGASDYDELVKLKELLNNDIITQEEFDMKKKQILGL